jgi:hypothetical protein
LKGHIKCKGQNNGGKGHPNQWRMQKGGYTKKGYPQNTRTQKPKKKKNKNKNNILKKT